MEAKTKIKAIVADISNDSKNFFHLEQQLDGLGIKYKYFKEIDDKTVLSSVLIILNEQSVYRADTNSFVHYIITNRIPMIVIYTDINDNKDIHDSMSFKEGVTRLWSKIPAFSDERYMVATVHIHLGDLKRILKSNDFVKGTTLDPSDYYLL